MSRTTKRRAFAVTALSFALLIAILVSSHGPRQAGAQGVLTPGGRGDITAVTAGSGLTGGATSGSATLNVGAGSGITVSADAIAADTSYLQRLVTGTCGAGSAMQVIGSDGSVICTAAGSTYTAGTSLTESPTGTFNVSLPGTGGTPCLAGTAVDWITSDGTASCGYSAPTYTAGDGLTLTASDFDVVPHASGGLAIVSDQVSLLQSCSSTQVLKWNGSAWACAADATGGTIDGTGSTNTMTSWSDSDTLTHSTATTHGVATSSATASTTALDIDATGTYNTTAGALNSVGFWSSTTTTRASGANSLNNYGGRFAASGAQSNYSLRSDGTSASGTSAWGGYFAATGAGTNTAVRAEASGGSTNIALSLSGALQANGDSGSVGEVLTLDGSGLPTWSADSSCLRVALACSANSECCTNNCDLGGTNKCIETPSSDTLGSDGDKGDVTVGGTGTTLSIDSGVVAAAELADNLDLSGNGTTTVGQFIGTTQTESGATLNDFALGDTTKTLYLTGTNPTLTGMTGGTDGREVKICHTISSSSIAAIAHESGSSTLANRFVSSNGVAPRLQNRSCVDAVYLGAESRWTTDDDATMTSLTTTGAVSVGGALAVTGASTHNGDTALGNADTDLTTIRLPKDDGTPPTLSSCGTSPSVTGGSWAFTVTGGSGATGCTATFAATKTNPPTCTITHRDGAVPPYTVSATAITWTFLTNAAEVFDVICIGDA